MKKAQVWGMDLMIAIIIFSAGVVGLFFYAINSNSQQGELSALEYDGENIGNSLLSPGSPQAWNESNVIQIGVLDNNKINETKLAQFYNLSASDYQRVKELFNTRYDFYFLLSKNITIKNGNSDLNIEGIGKKPENSENLIKITRYAVYNNTLVTAFIYVWEKE